MTLTQIFDEADPHVDSDTVFGVRAELVKPFDSEPNADKQHRYAHVKKPFQMIDMDFVLAPKS